MLRKTNGNKPKALYLTASLLSLLAGMTVSVLASKRRLEEARKRDQKLREKASQLAKSSVQLYERFNNPSSIDANTSQLAEKCEELAKGIKKLLP
jgi:hypothetical protein